MRTLVVFTLIVITGLCLIGCGGSQKKEETISYFPKPYPPRMEIGKYPSATSNLIFTSVKFTSGEVGYIGLEGYWLGIPDAGWLGTKPGFEYHDGEMGGTGSTLQVVSYTNGIFMYWAADMLWHISLFEGWKGQIETGEDQLTGIHLGSTASDFLAKFPDAKTAQPNKYGGSSYYTSLTTVFLTDYTSTYILIADCDAGGIIKQIRVTEDIGIKDILEDWFDGPK